MLHLRIGEHVIEPVDRATGHTDDLECAYPFSGGFLFHRGRQQGGARVAVGDAQCVGGVVRIGGGFGRTCSHAQSLKLAVVAGGDDDVAIFGVKGLVGHYIGVGVAHALGHLTADQIVGVLVGEPRHLRVEQRHVDVLALAAGVAFVQC